ncbi:type II secretion system F family protein [Paenibacillus sediminis]|uniref:Tight adherence protein C n=1 Tax=Paenibacillus sediminis TaxID=664909 RepID=A0ABS4H4I1_9BACL|nr:type II secretion system F family protein [Paenibacillus sediminis]MBP1937433.1 tight adherence protein C [Paenibacillus sediminis]
MTWALVLVLLVGGWVVLNQLCGRKYNQFRSITMAGLKLQQISAPSLFLLDKLRVYNRLPVLFFKIQRSIQKNYGVQHRSAEMTILFMAEILSYSWLLVTLGCLLSLLMNGEITGFGIGVLLAVLVPFSMIQDLQKKVQLRDQEILLELPELLNKIILLVGAGETVQQAITHCARQKQSEDNHPLYREILKMIHEWESGYSFQQSFDALSKRCGIQEVSIFTTTVLLNYRRGGNDFVLALRDLSRVLWERRKAISRTRGEQASSKLVFPMVLIFLVVLLLVGSPAFMMMKI